MNFKKNHWLPRVLVALVYSCLFIFISGCGLERNKKQDKELVIDRQVDSILELMTLEEKIGQMSQVRHFADITDDEIATKFIGSVIHTQGPTPGVDAYGWQERFIKLQKSALSTRLGIPLLLGVDAIHGQNTFEGATIFPHNIGLGATQNTSLVEEVAAITAIETQATGFNWTFSPCVAIPYNEKWGRVYEAFSESPELTVEMAKASVKGYQGSLDQRNTVLATAKHYIADGATDNGIEGGISSLTDKEVFKRLFPPYAAAVQEGVGAVMVSFNTLSGVSMHSNKELITDKLKSNMGFDGIVVSDWKGYTRFGKYDIINAGVDLVMAVDGDLDVFQNGLKDAIDKGHVPISRINDAVRRILRQKFRLNLFECPFPDSSLIAKIGSPSHRNIARKAVRESLVLLKNKNNTLPLDKNHQKIVVVGEHANSSGLQSGGWTIAWQGTRHNYRGATTILEGVQEMSEGSVVYDAHGTGNHTDADIAIIVVGETPYAEFSGDIRDGNGAYKLALTDKHKSYLNAYAGKGPKTIVILVSGRPLIVNNAIDIADAFVAAWLPGSEGDGIAEVLFGDYNFTGKLPHSWPRSWLNYKGKFGPNFWDESKTPLYQFGYGLAY